MKKLFQIFESRFATMFCIVFAITNRIIFATLYSTIGRDARMQITFAKNFIVGKGLGITKYFTADLNHPVFDTTQHFPPGFSFAIIPFLKLFNDDHTAVLAFDIATIFLFLFAVWFVAKKSGLPLAMRNMLMLIVGCSQYTFIMNGTSTDIIGITIVLWGLWLLIKVVDQSSHLKPANILFYALVFFLPSFFRYMYLPISLLFPVLIFAWGLFYKKRELKKSGIKLLGVIGIFVFLMLFLSYRYSGNSVYVFETERGVFFDQLVHWYPFIPASFINLDFIAQVIPKISMMTYTGVFKSFEIVNVILLVLLLFAFTRFLSFFKKQQETTASLFIVNGSIISLCILFLITYFSLTYKPQLYGIYLWNYNYESRYFAFVFIFLPIVLLFCLSVYRSILKNFVWKTIAFAGVFVLFIEIFHGIYYNVKIVSKQKDVMSIQERVADYTQFPTMLKELSEKYSQNEIVVSASDQVFLNTASQMGYKAIFDYTNLNKVNLRVTKKTFLLFPIHETDEWLMKEYIEKRKPQLMTKIAGTLFYLEEINP
jgi:hypothetical protein